MALDFPSSPTNGQVYAGYTYNSSKLAWALTGTTVTNMTVSDVAPSNPLSGDAWFDSSTASVFIYYNDGTSGQWVQEYSNPAIDTALTNRVTTVENTRPLSQNYLINGGFDIWQRGTSIATGTGSPYTADRWQTIRAGAVAGMTTTRQSSGLTGIQYCGRFQRDSGNANTAALQTWQTVETISSIPLAGSAVTISFYARAGANYSATGGAFISTLYTGTGTDQNLNIGGFTGSTSIGTTTATLTTSWQRFSFTATVGSSATQLGLLFQANVTGTAGTNDYFEVTGVQLEAGSTATAFRRNAPSIQAELAACQRYYYRAIGLGTQSSFGSGMVNTSTDGVVHIAFPVAMRSAPSVPIDTTGTAANYGIYTAPLNTTLSAVPAGNAAYVSTTGSSVAWSIASGGVAGQAVLLTGKVSGAYLGFSAEL